MLESSPRHSRSGAWPSQGMLSDAGIRPEVAPGRTGAARRRPQGRPGLVGGEPALPEELKGLALLPLPEPPASRGHRPPRCSGGRPSPVVPSPALQRNTFLGWNSPPPTTCTAVCGQRRPRGAPLPALHGGLLVQPQARPRSHTGPSGYPLPGSGRWMAPITAAPARSPGRGTGTTGSGGGASCLKGGMWAWRVEKRGSEQGPSPVSPLPGGTEGAGPRTVRSPGGRGHPWVTCAGAAEGHTRTSVSPAPSWCQKPRVRLNA